MPSETLVAAWLKGFQSDDLAAGGCAPLTSTTYTGMAPPDAAIQSSPNGDISTDITMHTATPNCSFTRGLEYGGGDLLPVPAPVKTAEECCALCVEHNACSVWTFDTELKKEPPTQPIATHHCYLKNDQVTVGHSSRFISGPPAPPPGPSSGWHNPCAGEQAKSAWCDEKQTNQQRAHALIDAMTIDEKAAMMSARANPGIPRLDIGAIKFSEALHGLITSCVSEELCATAFPAWIGMAASFDTKLWTDVATTIGTECRAFANIKASHTEHALAFWYTYICTYLLSTYLRPYLSSLVHIVPRY